MWTGALLKSHFQANFSGFQNCPWAMFFFFRRDLDLDIYLKWLVFHLCCSLLWSFESSRSRCQLSLRRIFLAALCPMHMTDLDKRATTLVIRRVFGEVRCENNAFVSPKTSALGVGWGCGAIRWPNWTMLLPQKKFLDQKTNFMGLDDLRCFQPTQLAILVMLYMRGRVNLNILLTNMKTMKGVMTRTCFVSARITPLI